LLKIHLLWILSIKFCFAKLDSSVQRSHPWQENACYSQAPAALLLLTLQARHGILPKLADAN
jgi:hypothetical protein